MLHWTKRRESPEAVATLRQAFDDPDPGVRSEAARLTGYKALNHSLTKRLLKSLSDHSPETRAMAARSLGWQKTPGVAHRLIELLEDREPTVVYRALRALSDLGATETLTSTTLARLQDSADPHIAREAQRIRQELRS